MRLGNPFFRLECREVKQLISRGGQLYAVTECGVVAIDQDKRSLFSADLKVRHVLSVAEHWLLACEGSVQTVVPGEPPQIHGRNSQEFWADWQVQSLARFEPLGFGEIERPITVAVANSLAGQQAAVGRFPRDDPDWQWLDHAIGNFEARVILGCQFGDERVHCGRVPVVLGKGEGERQGVHAYYSSGATPRPLGEKCPKDVRDAVVLDDGDQDRLFAVGQAGFFEYRCCSDSWQRHRDISFHRMIVEHEFTDVDGCPVIIAAGARQLVEWDGEMSTLLDWETPLIPMGLVVHEGKLIIAYQVRGTSGVNHFSVIEGYFEG